MGVLDRASGEIRYCNGGHTAGAIVRASGTTVALPANSAAVGAYPDMPFADTTAAMDPGDLLFLSTDGLIEARSAQGSLFGEVRLFEALARLWSGDPDRTVAEVMDQVIAFADGRLTDDAAVLALQLAPETLGLPKRETSA